MKTKEANEINLGRVGIFEPELESDSNVTLEFQIPARIYLYGRRSLEEYEKTTLEHIRIQSGVFFEITEFLSYLSNIECGRSPEELLEYINTLSYFAKSFSETSEIVQMEFERYRKTERERAAKESSETSPDFIKTNLLNNSRLPED